MWACLVVVTSTLLAAVCGDEQPTAVKKTYGGECTVEDDCESVYICSSKLKCDCRAGQVISSDKRTCLDTVLFGEPCNETAQCRLHLANSACNSMCQCEPGFLHVDSDDHSCVPAVKKTYGGECTVEDDCESGYICSSKLKCDCRAGQVISSDKRTCLESSGAVTAQFSVGLVMLACLYCCLLRAEPHTI